jgi:hypothetical protein
MELTDLGSIIVAVNLSSQACEYGLSNRCGSSLGSKIANQLDIGSLLPTLQGHLLDITHDIAHPWISNYGLEDR